MKLHPEWRNILRHAWSVRLTALAFVLSGAAGAFTLLPELPVPFWLRAAATVLAPVADLAAFIARPIAQKELDHG